MIVRSLAPSVWPAQYRASAGAQIFVNPWRGVDPLQVFLRTGCRDQEVTFAAWNDIDFTKSEYNVRRKEDVGFAPKSHESRTIPLPASLVALLKSRRKNHPNDRWVFLNKDGKPDNHFLRKLKKIARHAGLNCGQCRTTLTVGKYDHEKEVEVSCKTHPVCEHIYLHRFRKTCATRWQEHGIPLRTVQAWLGHKNLETTLPRRHGQQEVTPAN